MHTPAQALPLLYQEVLTLIAELERSGRSRLATRSRVAATRIYATGWDERQMRRLEELRDALRRSPS